MGVVKLRFSPVMHFTTETSVMVIFISGDADNCTENDSFLHFDFITVIYTCLYPDLTDLT